MREGLPLLLASAGVLLLATCLTTFLLLRAQSGQRRLQARTSLVASTVVPGRPVHAGTPQPASAAQARGPLARKAAALLGFNPQRTGHYPLKWWLVLPVILVIASLLASLLTSLVGGFGWVVLPVAWVLLCRFFFRYFDDRRRRLLYTQFPDALAMITRAVRVGIPVTEAIHTVANDVIAPTTEEFRILSDQLAIGVTLGDGLRELAERNSLPEYRFFATALSLQNQTGGGLSDTLDNLGEVIRKRLALRARAYALAAEARTSIVILAALPVVAAGALALLNPSYIGVLVFNPTGKKVLAMALVSLCTGIGVMKFIVKKSLT